MCNIRIDIMWCDIRDRDNINRRVIPGMSRIVCSHFNANCGYYNTGGYASYSEIWTHSGEVLMIFSSESKASLDR